MFRGRGHIPYRGEVRAKQQGNPSRPKPHEHLVTWFFGFGLVVVGFGLLFYAIQMAAQNDFIGVFVFLIYLMVFLIAIFSFRDLHQIEMLTPDEDEESSDEGQDATLMEDYLSQIAWRQSHSRRVPEPKWRFRPVLAKDSGKYSKKDVQLLILMAIAVILILGMAYQFGANSPLTITVTIAIGIIGTFVFLLIQDA